MLLQPLKTCQRPHFCSPNSTGMLLWEVHYHNMRNKSHKTGCPPGNYFLLKSLTVHSVIWHNSRLNHNQILTVLLESAWQVKEIENFYRPKAPAVCLLTYFCSIIFIKRSQKWPYRSIQLSMVEDFMLAKSWDLSDCSVSQLKTLSSLWTGLVFPTSLSQIHLGWIIAGWILGPEYRCLALHLALGKFQNFRILLQHCWSSKTS